MDTERGSRILTAITSSPSGVPLAEVMAAAPPPRLLRWFTEACRIVERAHERGIVHRELSPATILVGHLGEIHVVGWDNAVEDAQPDDREPDVQALGRILAELLAASRSTAPELEALCDGRLGSARELAEHVLAYLDGERQRAPTAGIVEQERAEMIRRGSRAGVVTSVAYLLFGPAFLWLGAGAARYAFALLVLVAANITVLYLQGFRGHRDRPVLVAAGNVALVVLIARATSPFLLAPGIAAITVMGLAFTPNYERPRALLALVAAMAAAVLGPWIGEQIGWLATTTTSTRDGFQINAVGLHLREGGQAVLMVLYTLSLLAAGAVLAFNLSRSERRLRYRIHAQRSAS
jgi:hypothetical protein